MGHSLEKADTLRKRLGATYEEAKVALDEAEGDLLGALVVVERLRKQQGSGLEGLVNRLVQEAGRASSNGSISRISIRIGDTLLTQLPVALTGVAAAVVGCLGVLVSQCVIECEGEDDVARDTEPS